MLRATRETMGIVTFHQVVLDGGMTCGRSHSKRESLMMLHWRRYGGRTIGWTADRGTRRIVSIDCHYREWRIRTGSSNRTGHWSRSTRANSENCSQSHWGTAVNIRAYTAYDAIPATDSRFQHRRTSRLMFLSDSRSKHGECHPGFVFRTAWLRHEPYYIPRGQRSGNLDKLREECETERDDLRKMRLPNDSRRSVSVAGSAQRNVTFDACRVAMERRM